MNDTVKRWHAEQRPTALRLMKLWWKYGVITRAEFQRLTNPQTIDDLRACAERFYWLGDHGPEHVRWYRYRPLWWRRIWESAT